MRKNTSETDISTLSRQELEDHCRRLQEELRSVPRLGEGLFNKLCDAVSVAVIIQQTDGTVTLANARACKLFGWTEGDAKTMAPDDPAWRLVTEDGNPVAASDHPVAITLRTGERVCGAVYGLSDDDPDRRRWLLIHTEPVCEKENSRVREVIVTLSDITELQTARAALNQKTDQLRRLFNGIPMPTYVWEKMDDDFVLIDFNDNSVEFTKGKVKSFLNCRASHMYATRPDIIRDLEQCYESQSDVHREMDYTLQSDGRVMRLAVSYGFVPPNRVIVHAEDITREANAEKIIQESEERLRNIVEHSTNLFYSHTTDHELTYLSPQTQQFFDCDPEEALVRWTEFATDNPVNKIGYDATMRAIETGVTQPPYELELIGRKKRKIWVEVHEAPVVKNGKTVAIVGALVDITDRKRAEEKLRESEEKFRSYVSYAPDAILVADQQGRCIDVNEAACRLTGYTEPELKSRKFVELLDSDITTEDLRAYGGPTRSHHEGPELRLRHKDGTTIWISLDIVWLPEDHFMAFCSDITETKRLREQENRVQRLETAGQIAGQVAHDFNNLLGPMVAYPSLIREELPDDHPILPYLRDIEESAHRIADINQQLLTLGRRGHYNLDTIILNEIVQDVVRDIRDRQSTIRYELDLDDGLLPVMGGRAQIHRAILNLITNAVDALPGRGTIRVRTENWYVDNVTVTYGRIPKGEYVKLTISDDGCGIPSHITDRIFDPFFTTKTVNKERGSGLGLSVVDAVVRDHSGHLDLVTSPGEGTSFFLYFPITRETAATEPSPEQTGGNETVLVVDDDKIQREVASRLLTKLGYRVSCVESGEAAVELLRRSPQDIVVLDMVMPEGIDGAETYKRMREISPHQKAIMVSGFSETARVREAQTLGAGAFVHKPLSLHVLAEAIRNELDRSEVIPADRTQSTATIN